MLLLVVCEGVKLGVKLRPPSTASSREWRQGREGGVCGILLLLLLLLLSGEGVLPRKLKLLLLLL